MHAENSLDRAPIFVDLDGTLLRSDVLAECLMAVARQSPGHLLLVPFWFLRGRPYLKNRLAQLAGIRVADLPYHPELLDYLREKKREGRHLILATAADGRLAGEVARHLDLFHHVLATQPGLNLKARKKLAAIQDYAGQGPFVYAGDSSADLVIFRQAAQSIVVNAAPWVALRASRPGNIIFSSSRTLFSLINQELRTYQWLKNFLVLAPLIGAQEFFNPSLLQQGCVAFLSFCLISSAFYILNDFFDLPLDRIHPEKKFRPLASGQLSLQAVTLLFLLCLGGSLTLSILFLSPGFLLALFCYAGLTVSYSLFFKRYVLLDLVILSLLYTLRIIAGGVATGITPTVWLLGIFLFLALSLTCLKRYTEILFARRLGQTICLSRPAYHSEDHLFLLGLGLNTGLLAVLLLALYATAADTADHYHHPQYLLLNCPLLTYFISRLWLKAYRGDSSHDPIVSILQDRVTYLIGLLGLLTLFLARD